jgi:hypothetical protein
MPQEREMDCLQAIEAEIRRYPGVEVTRLPEGVSVKASGVDGFNMTVVVEEGRCALYFDGWFEEFGCKESALRTIADALSGDARLRVDMLSGRRWRWTLETFDDAGQWVSESTISHVIWRFWGRKSAIYLRNNFGAPTLAMTSNPAGIGRELSQPPAKR